MSDADPVLTSLQDGVQTVTLNRPEARNGWTVQMEDAYYAALAAAGADDRVRAIVVTGAGQLFCPGLDAGSASSAAAGGAFREGERPSALLTTKIPKPVICALNGSAAGFGVVLALACDIRFMSSAAKLNTAFVTRGLPAEEGAGWLISRLAGHAVALDLLLSARPVLAEEALRLGLVNAVVAPAEVLPFALAYAGRIARSCSPAAMASTKEQIWGGLDRSLEEAHALGRSEFARVRAGLDFREGMAAFAEGRQPVFSALHGELLPESGPRSTG